MAASEKYWCRLFKTGLCQPDTVMGPENDTRGDFKILNSHSSFCLEKRQLSLNDTGLYRFTLSSPSGTKVYVVELQVKDKPFSIKTSPVLGKPDEYFQIICQYSQELQAFSKSWLCDNSECPDVMRSVDDRFQSALVLTIDHLACSSIRSFQCVAKMSASSVHSDVYLKPVVNEEVAYGSRSRTVQVEAHSLLNLNCLKSDRYGGEHYRWSRDRWWDDDFYYQHQPYWCKVRYGYCVNKVNENVKDTGRSLLLQICVTRNDDGTHYRCLLRKWNPDVQIVVIAPAPPQPASPTAKPKTTRNVIPSSRSGTENKVGIIIVVTGIIFLIIILGVSVTKCKGQKLWDRLFARRTQLSAVDSHANTYANSVAHYYRHQVVGVDRETSSSSDDEFEELPVRPSQKETDYVGVQPGEAACSQNVHAVQRDSEQLDQGGLPLRNCDNVSGLEDGDEDEVTYTHVIIKPKHQNK
ncbi:uncharacterized protein [Cebidichthys violaceus]|uniref:uncharacterized protein n=1 Tax=Cebidichthys violaceus TaxID=271503 RepID=UPI0035CB6858